MANTMQKKQTWDQASAFQSVFRSNCQTWHSAQPTEASVVLAILRGILFRMNSVAILIFEWY